MATRNNNQNITYDVNKLQKLNNSVEDMQNMIDPNKTNSSECKFKLII